MATFKRFEDIKAWKKARFITTSVYKISSSGDFATDFDLKKQMRRASVSIMANIAEGYGRRTRAEFANHLNIARGSAFEVQSLLYVALDLFYIDESKFEEVYSDLTEVSKMTLALAQYLRK